MIIQEGRKKRSRKKLDKQLDANSFEQWIMSINSADNRNSTKVSKASNYLSTEENELVFRLIGRRTISQCTTVAQLYQTESPTHSRWIKKFTGALCFVKDNVKRSYYCRMYCLMRHEVVWEHEMYDTIDIAHTRPYLLTFEGQVMPTKRDNLHKLLRWLNKAIHTHGFFLLSSRTLIRQIFGPETESRNYFFHAYFDGSHEKSVGNVNLEEFEWIVENFKYFRN